MRHIRFSHASPTPLTVSAEPTYSFARAGAGLLACLWLSMTAAAGTENPPVVLATSTSLKDSGLLDRLKPAFERDTGKELQLVTAGSGKAMQLAREGTVDLLLVHAPAAEEEFISQGFVNRRVPYMKNFFVVIGPDTDPARIAGLSDVREAFRRIAATRSLFISRADDSGNHQQEVAIWKEIGISVAGSWYYETGLGMAAVLSLANEKRAYALIDEATWLTNRQGSPLRVLVRDPDRLANTYVLMILSPKALPGINHAGAEALATWLLSERGRSEISSVTIDGVPIFTLLSP